MLPALCLAALAQAHSQHYNIKTCVQSNGTIRVDNPKISSTYWVQDSTCTFLLDHHVGTIDAISFTRASTDVMPGTLTLANGTVYNEDLTVHGEGEPFAMLPMYKTMQELKNIATSRVTVHVPGKAMVSFGMAEDPRLVFYGVVMDAYEARDWTYEHASVYLTFIHVGLFLLTLVAVLAIDRNNSNLRLIAVDDFMFKRICCGNLPKFKTRYKAMYGLNSTEGPYTANTALALSVWLSISVIMDMLIYTIWVWSRIQKPGGSMFLYIFVARVVFYAYLFYIIWEQPFKNNEWELFGSKQIVRFARPLVTGGLLTAHLGYWLHHGRDALDNASAYYITVPVIVGLACVVVPCVAGEGPFYTWPVSIGQLALVTFVGIMLNVGLGALAPLCVLFAFNKRVSVQQNPDPPRPWVMLVAAIGLVILVVAVAMVDWLA